LREIGVESDFLVAQAAKKMATCPTWRKTFPVRLADWLTAPDFQEKPDDLEVNERLYL